MADPLLEVGELLGQADQGEVVGRCGSEQDVSDLGSRSLLNPSEKRLLQQVLSGSTRMLDIDTSRGLLRLYVKALNAGWQE